MDRELAERDTPERKRDFVQSVAARAELHLVTSYASSDRAAGIRQATVDWANEQTDGRVLRASLHREQYQTGYEVMKENLERQWESWRSAHTEAGSAPSRDGARQVVREIAVEASRSIRENEGGRGSVRERFEGFDYDRGRRKAVMDWSHGHKVRLAEDQPRSWTEERSGSRQDYGISY